MRQWLFLLKLCRPQLKMMLLGFVLSFIALAANISLLALSGWFLAAMAAAGIQGAHMNYFTPAGIIRFLAIVRTAASYAQRLVNHNATFLLLKTLRVSLFSALKYAPDGQRSGDLFARFQDDIEQLDKFYLDVLLPILLALSSVPFILLVLGKYSGLLAIFCLLGLLLVGLLLPLWVHYKLGALGAAQRIKSSDLRNHLVDGVNGLKELKMADAQSQYSQQLQQYQQHYQHTLSKADNQHAVNIGLSSVVMQATLLGSFILLIILLSNGQITALELAMLTLLVIASFETVLPLPDAMLSLSATQAATQRIMALLPSDHKTDAFVEDNKHNREKPLKEAEIAFQCKQLGFNYINKPPCLNELNLLIKRGEKTAIVGSSGAGKTTLLLLLAGQITAKKGSITLFNQPVNSISQQQLHATVGILSQQHYIFSGTVRDNLLLSEPNADDEQLRKALQNAKLERELETDSLSLDTIIGSQGKGLSAGQARRVAIAQLLLRQSPIILLDEPTAGLDNHTQNQVIDALLTLFSSRTIIMISHEPRLLAKMDNVVWLDNAKVRSIDTHHQLRQKSEDYCNLTTVI